MITQLRTFLASWWRSLLVLVGCLIYVALVKAVAHVFPHVPLSLGPVWLVIDVLKAIVLGTATLIVLVLLAWEIIAPFIIEARHETPWADRSDKAKEKHADSLLSVSTALVSASFIALLVAPLTAFLQAVGSRRDLVSVLSPSVTPDGPPGWQVIELQVIGLIVLFFVPVVFGVQFRTRALGIYDELARQTTPAPSPGPDGATAAGGGVRPTDEDTAR